MRQLVKDPSPFRRHLQPSPRPGRGSIHPTTVPEIEAAEESVDRNKRMKLADWKAKLRPFSFFASDLFKMGPFKIIILLV